MEQGDALPGGAPVKLPDSDGVLAEAGRLCYNDADFLGDESQRTVHPSIANADAELLGALSLLMCTQVSHPSPFQAVIAHPSWHRAGGIRHWREPP